MPEQVTLADRIRRFAFENYVAPMRGAPGADIRIRAGEVHRGMGLSGRMPAVCGALDAAIFRREYGLELVRRTGPAQGANVEFVFRMSEPKTAPANKAAASPQSKLRFTLKGKTFEKERRDFIQAIVGKVPSRIQRYLTTINGERYPIRQVVAYATGLPAIAITSQDPYRILEKFGFAIETQEDANAPNGERVSAKTGAETALGEPGTQTHSTSLKIALPPKIEAALAARAAAEGVSLPEYVARLLTEHVSRDATGTLSPAERASAWREAAKGLPITPPLPDEAISRENLYSTRG
jgi:predicted HicB family RNase H-like nuclease